MRTSRWSALANAQPAPQLLLSFLSTRDVVCWLVSALEAADATAEQLLTQLRPRLEHDALVLHCAAAHGCLRAVWRLRRSVRHQRLRHSLPLPPLTTADELPYNDEQAALMRWTDTFRPFELPPGVVLSAAARGDLRVVQWLHATARYEPLRAMRSAAQRGHLHVVEWLASHFASAKRLPHRHRDDANLAVTVQLRLSETHGLAVAWAVTRPAQSAHRRQYTRFLATRNGFAAPIDTNDPTQLLYDTPQFAAATGDLALLRVLLATHTGRFSTRVLTTALNAGHVDVADWLIHDANVAVSTRFDMKSVVVNAIRKDHLRVLQWCRTVDELRFDQFFALTTLMLCSHLDIVQWSYALSPASPWSPDVLLQMAKNGVWDSVKWVYAALPRMRAAPGLLDAAATAGDLDAFALACDRLPASVDRTAVITERTLMLACASGNLALVQLIVTDHRVWSPFGASQAALAGHTAVVQWLLLNFDSISGRHSVLPATLASDCARAGHYACAEWLLATLPPSCEQAFPSRRCFEAGEPFKSRDASPSLAAWHVRSRALPWRRRFVELVLQYRPAMVRDDADFVGAWAARNGHSDIILRLMEAEYPFVITKRLLRHVLKTTEAGGLVRTVLEQQPDWLDLRIVRWATKYRQLSVLALVFASDRAFSDRVLRFAAHTVISTASRFGHVDVLQWMRAHDEQWQPWTPSHPHNAWSSALPCAAIGDHVVVVHWLLAEGLADLPTSRRALQAAIRSDSARVLETLRRLDDYVALSLTVGDVCYAMSRGSVWVVQWMRETVPAVLSGTGTASPVAVDRFLTKYTRILKLENTGNIATL